MQKKLSKYISFFSDTKFWDKLKSLVQQLGQRTIYSILLLYYAFKREDTPLWAKNIILGVLGYLISPFDALPDLTPVLGYTDDLGVLAFGLATVATFINDEVREKALGKMNRWFTLIDREALEEVDKKL